MLYAVADPENFGGGGFEAQNLKISDVFIKIDSDSLAEIGNSNFFFAQNQVVSKKKKKKKKKKGLHQNWEWFFAGFVTFRSVGGDASPPSPPLNPPLAVRIVVTFSNAP